MNTKREEYSQKHINKKQRSSFMSFLEFIVYVGLAIAVLGVILDLSS